MSSKEPISEVSVALASGAIFRYLNEAHRGGHDGRDVVLGALSAIRLFTLNNVGAEGYKQEIDSLVQWLRAEK